MRCFVSELHQLSSANSPTHSPTIIIPLSLITCQHRERQGFGTRASEVEENTTGLSLSLSNRNNWRRLWPEKIYLLLNGTQMEITAVVFDVHFESLSWKPGNESGLYPSARYRKAPCVRGIELCLKRGLVFDLGSWDAYL